MYGLVGGRVIGCEPARVVIVATDRPELAAAIGQEAVERAQGRLLALGGHKADPEVAHLDQVLVPDTPCLDLRLQPLPGAMHVPDDHHAAPTSSMRGAST